MVEDYKYYMDVIYNLIDKIKVGKKIVNLDGDKMRMELR
jgi:hypothetical protein